MKVFELLSPEVKAKQKKRADREHAEFLRKKNFSADVDAVRAKIDGSYQKSPITGGFATSSTTTSTGKSHGKIR
jgi:hypothetical protein